MNIPDPPEKFESTQPKNDSTPQPQDPREPKRLGTPCRLSLCPPTGPLSWARGDRGLAGSRDPASEASHENHYPLPGRPPAPNQLQRRTEKHNQGEGVKGAATLKCAQLLSVDRRGWHQGMTLRARFPRFPRFPRVPRARSMNL